MPLHTKIKTVWKLARSRPRGWRSLVYNTAMARARLVGPLMSPVHIAIEPTNACNARCPVCETGKGEMLRPTGMLDIIDFQRLINDVWANTTTLMFYFMGEPFLNRHAYDMIRYARDKGIYVETCTNGDFVDAQGVIYSDINKISFQISGLDNATHQRYRVRSDLDKVKRNLFALIEERRRHPESSVEIDLGFIVMRHNEHQVDDFLSWAREIGVDTANVIDPCVRNVAEGKVYLTKDRRYWFYDEKAFEEGILRPKHLPDNECQWIWNSIQINWNGEAVPCCRDPNGLHSLGNVFERGLWRVFNGRPARDFRRRILTEQGKVDICRLCSGYAIPELHKERPMAFSVRRHSFDQKPLVLPDVVITHGQAIPADMAREDKTA